jgi:hypothetical protein
LFDIFLMETARSAHTATPLAAAGRSIVESMKRRYFQEVLMVNYCVDLLCLRSLLLIVVVKVVMGVMELLRRSSILLKSDPQFPALVHIDGSRQHYRGGTGDDAKVPQHSRLTSRCDAKRNGRVLRLRCQSLTVVVGAHRLLARGTLPDLWQ